MKAFAEGFFLQASLILALGAQNLFVLESGLKKQRHLVVALVSSICDAVLIAIGVLGAASIFVRVPQLKIGVGVLGVGFLAYYGFRKLLEGLRGPRVEGPSGVTPVDLKGVIFMSIAFSLLNPHVYLDTVVLIGGYSAQFADLVERLRFGAGAASFSVIWFFGLSVFAYGMGRLLMSPQAVRAVCLVSGVILLGLSIKLGRDVYYWAV